MRLGCNAAAIASLPGLQIGVGGNPTLIQGAYTNRTAGYGYYTTLTADSSNRATQFQQSYSLYSAGDTTQYTNTITATAYAGGIQLVYAAGMKVDFSAATVVGVGGSRTEGTVAAAGTTQGTATAITTDAVEVTGADGTKGVMLKNTTAGIISVWSSDATNSLNVYPPSGATINALAADAPEAIAPFGNGAKRVFFRVTATQWFSAAMG